MSKTVRKAFVLLESLARDGGPRRVSEVAHEAGLTESSACRLLATLVELGYALRDDRTGLYSPTLKLWSVAHALVGRTDELHTLAQPVLDALTAHTGESSALGVFDDGYCVYLAKSDGAGAIRAVARIGARLPATATGFGKAIVAWRPELLAAAVARVQRFTERTLMARAEIELDLQRARERGYAITRGELFPDTCAIGVPVFDATGLPVAGIALWGPESAILGEREALLAHDAIEAARTLSTRLGYVEANPAGVGVAAAPPPKRRSAQPSA
jgi:IclR family transcriptional regulator, KDG regulon repressor